MNGLDREQIEAIVNTEQEALFHFALFLARDYNAAEDMAQETFLIACRKLAQEKPEGNTGKWLRGIARNVYLKTKSKRNTFMLHENLLEMADNFWRDKTGEGNASSPYAVALTGCLESLGDNDRKMIELRYGLNPGREALAQTLDISVPALESRLKRAKKQLKECIERKTGKTI
ncbi:MAG: sigma-70 family RNA polymerase sigma factor [Planctomycetes bacterium]|nr:sigma-70 family RNA polymerase sigma factor [Planctomycetota bacterium]